MKQALRLFVIVPLISLHAFAQGTTLSSKTSESAEYTPRVFAGKKNKEPKANGESAAASTSAVFSFPVTVFAGSQVVTDLKAEDFTVLIDGEPAALERYETSQGPVRVVLMLDASPSTFADQGGGKTDSLVMKAISARLISLLQPQDEVMVISFAEKLKLINEFTSDRAALERSLKKIEMRDGTALYGALTQVFEKHLPPSSYATAVVLMTDGVDTVSAKSTYETSLLAVERSNIPVYPVFFDTFQTAQKTFPGALFIGRVTGAKPEEYDLGRQYLIDLYSLSGSHVAMAQKFTVGKEWVLDLLPKELRSQYRLTVKLPAAKAPGTRHRLKVRIDRPGLTVLAKGSFIE